MESKSKIDRRDRISLMDAEDQEECLKIQEDEEIPENQDDENDTKEPGTKNRDFPRSLEFRRTRRTTGSRMDRPLIPKGYATSLEPQKMPTEISAQELEWWTRQWEALKNDSSFGYQSEQIKISYLCMFVDRKS